MVSDTIIDIQTIFERGDKYIKVSLDYIPSIKNYQFLLYILGVYMYSDKCPTSFRLGLGIGSYKIYIGVG